jgi:formylglycine-generating enzyme required for sulfatase activity
MHLSPYPAELCCEDEKVDYNPHEGRQKILMTFRRVTLFSLVTFFVTLPALPQGQSNPPRQSAPGSTVTNPKDGLTYVWIPPGTFQYGCSPGDSECGPAEKQVIPVTLLNGFWLGQTPVTQAAYQRIQGKNPSKFKGDKRPVETVSWDDASSYCAATGMRLPSEVEWEYAARAGGTASRYGDINTIAWYSANSGTQTHEVGQKRPNQWNLYDMLGNVWEWMAESNWISGNNVASYSGLMPRQYPRQQSDQYRDVRGGSWNDAASNVRVSNRQGSIATRAWELYGFRCAGETAPGETLAGTTKINSKDGLTYVWIPPGAFRMGCSPADPVCSPWEKPPHTVTISRGFWMGQTLVTQVAYQRVRTTNPSIVQGDKLPVSGETWDEAKAYCSAVGMRLPTEAEWEYAARAGTGQSRYGNLGDIAWYQDNSGGKPHDVGQKQPNDWKLYDMLGNMWEWTNDWYDANYYRASPSTDPQGPPSGGDRVQRGGSFWMDYQNMRVSFRLWQQPDGRVDAWSFRCAGNTLP